MSQWERPSCSVLQRPAQRATMLARACMRCSAAAGRARRTRDHGIAPLRLQGRDHLDFVVRLRERLPCRTALMDGLCGSLEAAGFVVQVRGGGSWRGGGKGGW